MSALYLTLYPQYPQYKEDRLTDLFTQAEKNAENDPELLRKIKKTLPRPMDTDKIQIYTDRQLAENIARLQGKLDQNDPQKDLQNSDRKLSF